MLRQRYVSHFPADAFRSLEGIHNKVKYIIKTEAVLYLDQCYEEGRAVERKRREPLGKADRYYAKCYRRIIIRGWYALMNKSVAWNENLAVVLDRHAELDEPGRLRHFIRNDRDDGNERKPRIKSHH